MQENIPRRIKPQQFWEKVDFGKMLTIVGAAAFILGYVYNIGYFLVIGPFFFSFLSINDHIAATLVALPFVLCALLLALITGFSFGIRSGRKRPTEQKEVDADISSFSKIIKKIYKYLSDLIFSIAFSFLIFQVGYLSKFNNVGVFVMILGYATMISVIFLIAIKVISGINVIVVQLFFIITIVVMNVGAQNANSMLKYQKSTVVHAAQPAPQDAFLLLSISAGAIVYVPGTDGIAFIPNQKLEYISGLHP